MEETKNILIRIMKFKLPWHWIPIGCLVLALLFFLLSFLGRFAWFFELFVNFWPQYLIVALISTVALSFKKKFLKFAIPGYAVSLIILLFILPVFVSPSPSVVRPASHAIAESDGGSSVAHLRIMHINVFTANGEYEKVENAILKNDPDIVLLEEVNEAWLKNFASIKKKYPFSIQYPREDNFGIAMFAKTEPKTKYIRISKTGRVPYIYAVFRNTVFFGVHTLPPVGGEYFTKRNEMIQEIGEEINKHKDKKIILLGDLNTTPWSYFFKKLETDTGLINSQKGFGIQPSWPDKLFFLWIPIDHCLVSPDINVKDRKIGKWVGSDHYPLVVDLEIPE